MVPTVLNEYISGSCNGTPSAVDWGPNDMICFGLSNCVAVYKNSASPKIIGTLFGHKFRVNSTKWIRFDSNGNQGFEIISGSSDCNGMVSKFTVSSDSSHIIPEGCAMLEGHSGSVVAVDALYVESFGTIAVTGSTDSTVKVWIRYSDQFSCVSTLKSSSNIVLTASLVHKKVDSTVLLAYTTETGINLCKADILKFQKSRFEEEAFFEPQLLLTEHKDWVYSLDFYVQLDNSVMLASGSQDCTVRLWHIKSAEIDQCRDDAKLSKNVYPFVDKSNFVELHSTLNGHQNWVYGVHWFIGSYMPVCRDISDVQLLTVSMDKTIIVWKYDSGAGTWIEKARLGDVGGNTLGFVGGKFSPRGDFILAYGMHGAFYMWHLDEESDSWVPSLTVKGHFESVSDIGWDPDGRFLLSVGADQTTRLHAPLKNNDFKMWQELARPQVHGHDLVCLAVLPDLKFVSGADEKIIRVFAAPRKFISTMKLHSFVGDVKESDFPHFSAEVASLELSNKPCDEESAQGKNIGFTNQHSANANLPTEEDLTEGTLWPEMQKLYSHGYEIFSLAASPDAQFLASACKATTREHASIIIWNLDKLQKVQKLSAHNLTVTAMEFSPDNTRLLSVSRDRTWAIFNKVIRDGASNFELWIQSDKKTGEHARIIWCCCWSHDSKFFVSGSRDAKLVIWDKSGDENDALRGYKSCSVLQLEKHESVRSVACAPRFANNFRYLVAIGLETGRILLYSWDKCLTNYDVLAELNNCHTMCVRKLAFRPVKKCDNAESLHLASCAEDTMVRIYNLSLRNI